MMLEENNIVFLKKKITKNRLTGSTIFIQISKSEFLEPTYICRLISACP